MTTVEIIRNVFRSGFDLRELAWTPGSSPVASGSSTTRSGRRTATSRTPSACCCGSRPARTATSTSTWATS